MAGQRLQQCADLRRIEEYLRDDVEHFFNGDGQHEDRRAEYVVHAALVQLHTVLRR